MVSYQRFLDPNGRDAKNVNMSTNTLFVSQKLAQQHFQLADKRQKLMMTITSMLCGFHMRPESASPSSAASSPDAIVVIIIFHPAAFILVFTITFMVMMVSAWTHACWWQNFSMDKKCDRLWFKQWFPHRHRFPTTAFPRRHSCLEIITLNITTTIMLVNPIWQQTLNRFMGDE